MKSQIKKNLLMALGASGALLAIGTAAAFVRAKNRGRAKNATADPAPELETETQPATLAGDEPARRAAAV